MRHNLVAALVAIAPIVACAQTTILDGLAGRAVQPGTPAGSYALNNYETIDLYGGKVNIAIPLLPITGRGTSAYTITAANPNMSWLVQVAPIQAVSGGYSYGAYGVWGSDTTQSVLYTPGFVGIYQYAYSPITCTDSQGDTNGFYQGYYTYIIFTEPNGTQHKLLSSTPNNGSSYFCGAPSLSGTGYGPLFVANDGSNIQFVVANGQQYFDTFVTAYAHYPATGTLFFPDGRQYTVTNNVITQITDRNGNITTLSYASSAQAQSIFASRKNLGSIYQGGNSPQLYVQSITDSTGRTYSIDYNTADTGCGVAYTTICDAIVSPAEGTGSNRTVIRYVPLWTSGIRADISNAGNPAANGNDLFPGLTACGTQDNIGCNPAGVYMLSEIDLFNGTSWHLSYNWYGEIARVVLPSGGAIEYDFGPGLTPGPGIYSNGQVLDNLFYTSNTCTGTMPAWAPFIYRRLKARREYGGSSGPSDTLLLNTATYSTTEAVTGVYDSCARVAGGYQGIDNLTFSNSSTNPATVIVHRTSSAGNAPDIYETHRFHLYDNSTSPYGAAAALNYESGNNGQHTALWSLAVFPFEGMGYHTEISPTATGTPTRVIDRAYSSEQNGTAALVCQENTTYADGGQGNSVTSTRLWLYDTDFGNVTDEYDYDFGTSTTVAGSTPSPSSPALQIQTSAVNGFTYLGCYASTIPSGWLKHTHTDYVDASSYISPTATTPAFLPNLVADTQVFDQSGKLTSVTYSYDTSGGIPNNFVYSGVTQSVGCVGGTTSSSRGNVNSITSGVGTTIAIDSLQFDCVGNVVSHTDPNNNNTSYTYTDSWWTGSTPSSAPSAGLSAYSYLNQIQLPNSATTTRQYDFNLGMVRQESVQNDAHSQSYNLLTTYDYRDPLNRLKSRLRGSRATDPTIPANTVVTYSDTPGSLSVTVASDQYSSSQQLVTTTTYDGLGRSQSAIAGTVTPITVTKAYDGYGELYTSTNPALPSGNLTDGTITYTYDENNRVRTVQEPDNSLIQYSYSIGTTTVGKNVHTVLITDEAQNQRTLEYDGLGRLAAVIEPSPGTTTNYTYTGLGELLTVSNGINQSQQCGSLVARCFSYDGLRRLNTATNPESGTVTYSYDLNGNTISKKDARGMTTCFGVLTGNTCDGSGYDSLNRPTHITYWTPNGFSDSTTQEVHYCYDGATYSSQTNTCSGATVPGQMLRRTSSANATSFTNYVYDIAGRLTSSTQTTGGNSPYTFSYTYYNNDTESSLTYPSGLTATTCYDSDQGRPSWVSRAEATSDCVGAAQVPANMAYASGFQYTPPGGLSQMTLGNGMVEQDSWNNRLQMMSMTAGPTANPLLQLNLYPCSGGATSCTNNVGNIWRETITIGTQMEAAQEYRHDALNRLTSASEGPTPGFTPNCANAPGIWCQQMTMDAVGNTLTASYVPALASSNSYPTAINSTTNQISQSSSPCSLWCYDSSGNLTADGQGNIFSYDAANRQVTFCPYGVTCQLHPYGGLTEYAYDADGERVLVTNNTGAQTVFVYSGGELAAEYSATSQTYTGTQYITLDQLGSTRLVTDTNGGVVARHDYFPFGTEVIQAGTWRTAGLGYPGNDDLRLKFTGKQRDIETGLDYFGARYLSSAQGRWTVPDELFADQHVEDPQSWNMYGYVRNNPLRYTDPDGGHCLDGFKACLSYLWGGVKAVAIAANSIPYSLYNAPTHIVNTIIRPFTSYRFAEPFKSLYLAAANEQERQGMDAADFTMMMSPLSEVGAATEVTSAVTYSGEIWAKQGIYEFPSASGRIYVGQSGDIPSRILQHLRSSKLLPSDISKVRTLEVLGGKTAREIAEQMRINQLGGLDVLENIRNPIGPNRQYLLQYLPQQ